MAVKFERLFVLTILIVISLTCLRTYDADGENFDSMFVGYYGHNSVEYFGLGEDGLVGKWVPDEQVANLNCKVYDSCNFLEIATVLGCPEGVRVEFSLYDDEDKLLVRASTLAGPLSPGETVTVEIGADDGQDFSLIEPTSALCAAGPFLV